MDQAKNIIEAIKLINSKRVELAGVDALWNKLYNASRYLDKQVAELLAAE